MTSDAIFGMADLAPLALDLLLCVGLLLVFVTDLFIKGTSGQRALAYVVAFILAAVFAASFFIDTSGVAFAGTYVGGDWPLFFKRVFLATGVLAVLGSVEHVAAHQPHRQSEYYLLLLFSLLGMTLLAGARDLILLLVCFELMSLPLFVLASYAKTEDRGGVGRFAPEAGLKLYLVGVASTAITLFGLSLVFGMTGTTNIERLAATPASPLLALGMVLVLAGMGFKIGMVPFHMWVPDTYQGASTPFVAFLSVAPKVAGFAALATLFLLGFAAHSEAWLPVLLGLCLVSMTVGNLLAIAQDNVKRLLAYSGIAHIGYMSMAFAASNADGAGMLLFYCAAYAATNMGAFLVTEVVSAQGGDDSIRSFDGLAQRAPWLALAMLLFLLSLGGIPFVVGFWAKLYVFVVAWQAGYTWLVVAGAVLAVLALFYYLRIARAMYMTPAGSLGAVRAHPAIGTAIALCLIGVVVMGLYPAPVVEGAINAARPFFVREPLQTSVPVTSEPAPPTSRGPS